MLEEVLKGRDKMEKVNPLEEVLVLSEAAALVNRTEGCLRAAIKNNRLKEGRDYIKSGRIILVLKEAAIREWGK